MRDIVIQETMYDMDKNRDGTITLEEYISKLLPFSLPPSLPPSLSLSLSLTSKNTFSEKLCTNKSSLSLTSPPLMMNKVMMNVYFIIFLALFC